MAHFSPQQAYTSVWSLGDQHTSESSSTAHHHLDSMEIHDQEVNEELANMSTNNISEIFFDAVRRGDLNLVRLLHIHHQLDVNSLIGIKGEVALHVACKRGLKELVRLLLEEAQADLEKYDNFPWNRRAIHCAALGCHPEILKLLIEKGAQLDSQNSFQETAAHIAISRGYTECSRLLIQHGCDLTLQDSSGNTPLHLAIIGNAALDIIQLMVSNLGSLLEIQNEHGHTALLIACHQKNYAVVELLVEAEANIQAVDFDGNTALILAVSYAYEEVVQSVPLQELSPSIFQIYQNPEDGALKDAMKYGPILSLFCFLIQRGCPWDVVNLAGRKAADILLEGHCPQFIIEALDRMVAKWKTSPVYLFSSATSTTQLMDHNYTYYDPAQTMPLDLAAKENVQLQSDPPVTQKSSSMNHDSPLEDPSDFSLIQMITFDPSIMENEQLIESVIISNCDASEEFDLVTQKSSSIEQDSTVSNPSDTEIIVNDHIFELVIADASSENLDHHDERRKEINCLKERKRRTDLGIGFQKLRSLIPDFGERKGYRTRISQLVILEKATKICQSLTAEEKRLLEEKDALENQQIMLRKRITALIQR